MTEEQRSSALLFVFATRLASASTALETAISWFTGLISANTTGRCSVTVLFSSPSQLLQ
ncbi:hypothetical protein [Ferrimonas lipolytica]|uniref:Uncharacterized protein n=1 Tax=Ferrimonas lipolytica TaxID=2724191 RepID=A0A6H1UDE8_9GAMM|nr:hypothetical protein [Ferrimonas lipolytica]QIZ77064.1 hypothetical protein HER31_09310 [Ferrimonas lipolytica]